MYARVTSIEGDPENFEMGVKIVQENVIPAVRGMEGFKAGWWLADREGGKMIGVTLWDSKEALDATEEAANRLRSESTQQAGSTVQSVASYEVIAQA